MSSWRLFLFWRFFPHCMFNLRCTIFLISYLYYIYCSFSLNLMCLNILDTFISNHFYRELTFLYFLPPKNIWMDHVNAICHLNINVTLMIFLFAFISAFHISEINSPSSSIGLCYTVYSNSISPSLYHRFFLFSPCLFFSWIQRSQFICKQNLLALSLLYASMLLYGCTGRRVGNRTERQTDS